nr:uncharacterized protein LOC112754215 [Arachis hypogaea]
MESEMEMSSIKLKLQIAYNKLSEQQQQGFQAAPVAVGSFSVSQTAMVTDQNGSRARAEQQNQQFQQWQWLLLRFQKLDAEVELASFSIRSSSDDVRRCSGDIGDGETAVVSGASAATGCSSSSPRLPLSQRRSVSGFLSDATRRRSAQLVAPWVTAVRHELLLSSDANSLSLLPLSAWFWRQHHGSAATWLDRDSKARW